MSKEKQQIKQTENLSIVLGLDEYNKKYLGKTLLGVWESCCFLLSIK
jgi:hypothetical protein